VNNDRENILEPSLEREERKMEDELENNRAGKGSWLGIALVVLSIFLVHGKSTWVNFPVQKQ
jgi:hypothetical protein